MPFKEYRLTSRERHAKNDVDKLVSEEEKPENKAITAM